MCILHLYPSIGRHPCCLHILVIVNNAAMNIQVLISVQISIFVFLGEITRSLYAGLFHSFILYFFEESQCCFPQWLYQFKFLPTVHELSFFSTFSQMLDNGHFGNFICISLMISNVECLLCLLDICISSLEKYLWRSSAHLLFFGVEFCEFFVYFEYLTLYWVYHLQIFSPIFVGCLFILLIVFFNMQKLFSLM